jgi:hypothetical protein
MQVFIDLSNVIAGLCSLVIAIRLLTYKRGQRQHDYWMALLSWCLINLNIAGCLFLLLSGIQHPFAIVNMVFTIGFMCKLIKTKGNLAHALFQRKITQVQPR